MPLAFFCTLFFRHRKKSVSAPWDGKSQSAPESARHSPPWGIAYGNVVTYDASRVAFRSPPCTPFGSPTEAIERPIGLQALFPRRSRRVKPHQRGIFHVKVVYYCCKQGAFRSPPAPLRIATRNNRVPIGLQVLFPRRSRRVNPRHGELLTATLLPMMQAGGFPRGKQSTRPALPCAPLVVCLNSGSLTAFGGCAHWARASLRSPLHPLRIANRSNRAPHGTASPNPRRSRRVRPRRGRGLRLRAHWGPSARPQSPSGRVGEKTQGHAFLQKTQRAFLGANNRRGPPSARCLPPIPKQAARTNVRTACFWEPRMPVRGHSTKSSCRLPAALAEVSVAQTRRGLILPLFAQTGQNQNNDCDQIGERFENLLHAPI